MSDLVIERDQEVARRQPAVLADRLFTPSALSAVDMNKDWFGVVVANASFMSDLSRSFVGSSPLRWAVVRIPCHGAQCTLNPTDVIDGNAVKVHEVLSRLHDVWPIENSKQMAERLINKLGLPITALSDVLDVQRKTIYDWMNGAEAKDATVERLCLLVQLFNGEKDGALRSFHRFWNRSLSDGSTLRTMLTSSFLDTAQIQGALDELRPAVEAAMATEAVTTSSTPLPHPADLLSAHLQVGSR